MRHLSLRATTLVLLSALLGFTVSTSHAASRATAVQAPAVKAEEGQAKGAMEIETSLADLGHKSGFQFEGVQPSHEQTVYFPVPRDSVANGGVLRVHYRFSPLLHKHSNLRVYINDTPRNAIQFGSTPNQVLEIPLTKADLNTKDGLVKVQFKIAMLFTDDRCLDERINGGYVHILPETALTMSVSQGIASLRGVWQMLPKKVTVSLPQGAVTQDVFAAAWSLNNLLMREGKTVSFVRLPEIGDITVAPLAEVRSALEKAYPNQQTDIEVPGGKFNAAIIKVPGKRVIGFTEPFDVTPFYMVTPQWVNLGLDAKYHVAPVQGNKVGPDERYKLALSTLGLDTGTRYVSRQAEWNMVFSPERLPAGYMPERLEIDVTATPATTEHPAMFYVYLNNVLQKAVRLENDGQTHQISVSLPKEALTRHNAIRLVAQREDLQGDCHGDAIHYPMQVMPQSSLIIVRNKAADPKQFVDLGPYFAEGFDIYLPKSYLQQPENVLNMLTRLSIDQSLAVDYKRITFFDQATTLKPTKPFLVLDRATLETAYAPVRFDKGRVQVVDGKGATLLDVDQLPGLAVAQIVKSGSVFGLWVAPGQAGAKLAQNNFQFERDDLSFVDAGGVVLSVDSHDPSGAKVYYPGYRGWMQVLSEYRFWLLVLAWVLLTVVVIYLFRRTRQHKNAA